MKFTTALTMAAALGAASFLSGTASATQTLYSSGSGQMEHVAGGDSYFRQNYVAQDFTLASDVSAKSFVFNTVGVHGAESRVQGLFLYVYHADGDQIGQIVTGFFDSPSSHQVTGTIGTLDYTDWTVDFADPIEMDAGKYFVVLSLQPTNTNTLSWTGIDDAKNPGDNYSSTFGDPDNYAPYAMDHLFRFEGDVISSSTPAPEPASWAMMVGGFGLVGGAMRSRRRVTAVRFG